MTVFQLGRLSRLELIAQVLQLREVQAGIDSLQVAMGAPPGARDGMSNERIIEWVLLRRG